MTAAVPMLAPGVVNSPANTLQVWVGGFRLVYSSI
jgi:hypothetical protein